jgi:hypothetical protein
MTFDAQVFCAALTGLAMRGVPAPEAVTIAHEFVAAAQAKPDMVPETITEPSKPEAKAKSEPKKTAE